MVTTYRAGPAPPATVFTYGPFPQRGTLLLLVVAVIVSALLVAVTWPHDEWLTCRRPGVCEGGSNALLGGERSIFDPRDVKDVQVVRRGAGKRGTKPVLVWLDAVGREHVLAEGSLAQRELPEARAFFLDKSVPGFEVHGSTSESGMIGMLVVLTMATGLLLLQVRNLSVFRIHVDPARDLLSVEHSLFGLRLGTRRHALGLLTGVRTDSRTNKNGKSSRLILLRGSNDAMPLTHSYYPAGGQHDLMREELSRALLRAAYSPVDAQPPVPADLPGRPTFSQVAPPLEEPAAPPAVEPRRPSFAVKMLLALVALPGAISVLYAVSKIHSPAGPTGHLHITAIHQCQIGDNFLLTPGGVMGDDAAPVGVRTIKVWNTSYPGNWEPIRVFVEAGKTTEAVCRPGAGDIHPSEIAAH